MNRKTRKPCHPGKVLLELYMRPLGLSVSEVARRLGISRKTLSRIVNGCGGIIPEMAVRLSRAFGTSPELWMNLQSAYDLYLATQRSDRWKAIRPFPRGKVA